MRKHFLFTFLLALSLFSYLSTAHSSELSVDDFLTPPSMLNASLSPNGKFVASTWNKGDSRLIVVYDIDNQKVVGSFGDNIIRAYKVTWANNERILVNYLVPHGADKLRKKAQTEEDFDIDKYFKYSRLVSTKIDGTDSVGLFNDQSAAKKNTNLVSITDYLVNDDAHVLMSTDINTRLTLFKLNVNTGKSTKIVKGGRFTVAFLNDSEANIIYRYDYRRVAKTIEILTYNATEDDWKLIDTLYYDEDEQNKNRVELKDLAGVKDKQLIYRKLNEETGYHELISVGKNEQKTLVSIPDTDIVGVITEGVNYNVIGYKTVKDVYRSHYFDQDYQAAYNQLNSIYPLENFEFTYLSKDRTRALLATWGASNPITYYVHDLEHEKTTHFSYPFKTLPKNKLARGQAIHYPARDGASITAYLYLPADFDGSKPVIPPESRSSFKYKFPLN